MLYLLRFPGIVGTIASANAFAILEKAIDGASFVEGCD